MSEENKLGHYLKTAREEAGLSLGQAANVAETDKAYIYRLENGKKSNPSPDVLLRLAHAYERSSREAFRVAGIPIPEEALSIDAHLRADYGLSSEAVDEVKQQIKAIAQRYHERSKES